MTGTSSKSSLAVRSLTGCRPLLATDDIDLLDDLLRLSAAAQVRLDVATSLAAVKARWSSAPLVIVGADLVADLGHSHVPRREGVVLAARSPGVEDLWQQAVALGAEHVAVLPESETWLVDRFAELNDADSDPAPVLAVIGARGGAGASTLTAALGITAAATGLRSRVIDLDPLGPGLDVVLGAEDCPGLRWQDLARANGRIPATVLDQGLPEVDGVRLLTWGAGLSAHPPAGAVAASIDALRRVSDLVVVDLHRGLGDSAGEAISRASCVLLVVPRDVCSVAAASRIVGAAELDGVDLRLVARGPAPGGLDASAIAEVLGFPLLESMERDSRLDADLAQGLAPATRRRAALRVSSTRILSALGIGEAMASSRDSS